LETFQEVESLRFREGEDYAYVLFVSDNALFAGLYSKPGGITKVDLTTFKETDYATSFSEGEDNVWSLIVHDDSVYAGLEARPGGIIKLDRNLKRLDAFRFSEAESSVYALVSWNESLICGLYTSPGKIILLQTKTPAVESTPVPSTTIFILPIATGVLLLILTRSILRKRRQGEKSH
jgi:hypothetical protein